MKHTMHLKPRRLVALPLLLLVVAAWLWHRMPTVCGELTRQTVFVAVAQAMQARGSDDTARLLWVDDDGGDGIWQVKRLCDAAGIRATFALVPSRLSSRQADSLARWQRQGYGIALHGLRHDNWDGWTAGQVTADLRQSRLELARRGIDTLRLSRLVVPPHARNTRAIRQAIAQEGCQMVTGANVLNSSATSPLLGRLWIDRDTDLKRVRQLLEQARVAKAFVVLATHSSAPDEFDYDKVLQTIGMAREMGFDLSLQ